ncbi:hypothetical protein GCM10009785_06120 [Brooklawnia cerclae]|uniref:Uncharacterized membrane protein YhaH (DUF805 family) n=1 Tax=Brooklawnia cerclae TaxID=349934 RepID=A0ABX0SBU5_9ACTN|nr:DUF805 domain-containing protein [Brooklawnia cerclae]NIH55794.1 uncharacterized membrane protein YhaH (DUF805 family) [Brooklawnia cerclae]
MSYTDSIKFTLSNYAKFTGRASRQEWVYWFLTVLAINIVLSIINGATANDAGSSPFSWVQTLFSLAVLVPTWSVGFRRFHDQGKSGWWILLNIFLVIGTIIYIIMAVRPGEPGPNAHGPNPESPETGYAPQAPYQG